MISKGKLLLVDKEPAKVEAARARGFEAVLADVADPAAWQEIAPDDSTTVVITTQDDDINLGVVEILKENHEVDPSSHTPSTQRKRSRWSSLGARTVTPASVHPFGDGEPGALPRSLRPPQPRGRGGWRSTK